MRLGILTSGGDCQALNATMRGLVFTLQKQVKDLEIIGFIDGYKGLMYENYKEMSVSDFEDILNLGGTILGSSRCPFKKMRVIENGFDKVEAMKKTYKKLKLDCLAVLGGNGSLKSANMLYEEGLHVIGLPKTIDNDTWGTDYTFGFQSAIDVATLYLEQIHTTAKSHSRLFVVEIMGHKVGHICLQSGIASGVDAILLPEIPYDINNLVQAVQKKQKQGQKYFVIACAEGALSKDEAALSKKQYKRVVAARDGRSVAFEIADKLGKYVDMEVRVSCCGHVQRGGHPCAYDKVMATRFGREGAKLILNQQFGRLPVYKGGEILSIPLADTAGKLKYVDPQSELVLCAKDLGISFGDSSI
ncbi:MAG: 6-phosphofructokinase [Faecalibacillus sp.]